MSSLKLFVASWNVGNAKPDGIEQLLPVGGGGYDLIVLGMQESTYTAELDKDCIHELRDMITSTVGTEYGIIKHNRRAQMQLYIIASNSIIKSITNIEANAENTGLLGIFPNKVNLKYFVLISIMSFAYFRVVYLLVWRY
jgi:hypothetical protein